MSETTFSYDDFVKCIQEIVKVSNGLMDGWKLEIRENMENGKFITRKQLTEFKSNNSVGTFEYHIAYSVSYNVPVLCFNLWKSDGSLYTLEEYSTTSTHFDELNIYETLTQMDHPVLHRPFLTLHPCKTFNVIEPFLKISKNPVISWLTVIGRFVDLNLLNEYIKCC